MLQHPRTKFTFPLGPARTLAYPPKGLFAGPPVCTQIERLDAPKIARFVPGKVICSKNHQES